METTINWIHILVFAPLLIWISRNHSVLSNVVRVVIAIVAAGVFYYHFNKARATNSWISWFHVLVVAPLLGLIAWKGASLSKREDQAIVAVAVAAIAVHAWRIYEKSI